VERDKPKKSESVGQNGHHFKMAANIEIKKNQNKLLKIKKFKYFNGNGYLQGVRHAAQYCDHFGLLWRPF
jgi:hypothetical protein